MEKCLIWLSSRVIILSLLKQLKKYNIILISPHHELDYGTILCWAENQLGVQDEPCSFHIIPAGKNRILDPGIIFSRL